MPKNKNQKKPESFVLSFKCRKENKKKKTKLRVLTSGGGWVWESDLDKHTFAE